MITFLTITEDERSDSDERMKIYVNGVKLLDLDNDYSVGTTGVAYNENGLSNADVFTDGQTTGANGTVQYNAFVPFFWPNENGVTVGLDGSDGGAMSHMRLWFYDTNDSILTDAQVEALYHSWLGTVKFNKPTNSNFEKLNIEGLPNQVKLNENGIKIGKNSWLTSSVPPSLGNTFTAEFLVKNVTKSLTNKHVPYFFMGNKTAGLDFYDAISGPTNSSTKLRMNTFP